jgi:hypothetical protein
VQSLALFSSGQSPRSAASGNVMFVFVKAERSKSRYKARPRGGNAGNICLHLARDVSKCEQGRGRRRCGKGFSASKVPVFCICMSLVRSSASTPSRP